MNMAKLLLMLAVMAISFNHIEASASDSREHQLCHVKNLPIGTFITSLKASLAADPTGNRVVAGCNATPRQFMDGINNVPTLKNAGFTLDSVDQLPEFMSRLEERTFVGKACLSGMRGNQAVFTCERERAAHPREKGYWYGEHMVFAGDCMNTLAEVAATQLSAINVTDRHFEPLVRERTDPFANRRRTMEGQCAFPNDRYFGVMVFEAKAAQHECAVRTMLPFGGRLGARDGGGNGGTYHDPNRFSRTCGAAMRGAQKAGEFNFSSTPHQFEVIVDNGTNEEVIFIGTVTGNTITGATEEHSGLIHESGNLLYLPDVYKSGDLVIRYLDPDGLRTPTASGTGERVENIKRGCKVGAFYAIDADGSARRDVASRD